VGPHTWWFGVLLDRSPGKKIASDCKFGFSPPLLCSFLFPPLALWCVSPWWANREEDRGVLCYAHPGILQDLLLHRLFFCWITDRDCVTRRPSTSRLYRNVGVDFTSSSPTLRHGEMAGTLGALFAPPPTLSPRPHVDLRRLVVASTDRDAFTDFAHRRLTSRYSI